MKLEYSKTYLYKLHTLTNTLDKAFDLVLSEYAGVSFSQFSLLLSVNEFGSASQRSIADFLQVTPAAVSRQVEVANRCGYLYVKTVDGNRRKNRISLTLKGEKAIYKGHDSLEKYLFKVFDDGNRSLDLMQHIDLLFSNTKGVINEQTSRK